MRCHLAAALMLALGLSGTVASAEAPATSPFPKPAPAQAGARQVLHPRLRPKVEIAPAVIVGDGPATSIRPKRRPTAALRPDVVVQATVNPHALPLTATVPPPARPENLRRLAQAHVVTENMPQEPAPAQTTKRGSVCGVAAIKGSVIPPIRSKVRGCGLEDGVKVTSVAGLPLSVPATIDCPTARALNLWADQALIPMVGRLGGGVARIDIMGSYECRPRNNQRGAKVSEHGKGKAVDIGGITLKNGTSITVLKGWNSLQHGKLLRKLHRAACGPFGTVLGPAANSYHRNHFHFDTAGYRSGSYCE